MRNIGQDAGELSEDPPVLEAGLAIYLEAFYALDTERNHAWGPAQIPWSKIQLYARENSYSERQTDHLHHHIRAMDRYELERVAKKQEQDRKARERKNGNAGRSR